jgi:hypothetical protein
MADQPPIQPVELDRPEGVRPLPTTPAVPRASDVAPTTTVQSPTPTTSAQPVAAPQSGAAAAAGSDGLGAAVERTQLAAGAATEPADVELRAAVHDAAEHGNPIASAIERAATDARISEAQRKAHNPLPSEIDPNAAMLGGAAASAHSGQSAVIQRTGRTFDPSDRIEAPSATDPLAPVDSGSDDDQRRRRSDQARRALEHDEDDGATTGGYIA